MTSHTQSSFPLGFALKKVALAAASAFALLGATPAMAGVVGFESAPLDFYFGGDVVTESGFALKVVDTHEGGGGLAGMLVNGQDPTTCALGGCPTNNGSRFYTGLADGALQITRASSETGFSLGSFDFAFVAPTGVANFSYGQLVLTGVGRDSGLTSIFSIDFPGTDGDGNPLFDTASLSPTFGSTIFSSLTIRACLFDGNGGCTFPHTIDDANLNQAQFAIDNITLSEVPEPGSLALLGLGLSALTLRRRKSATARNAKNANNTNNA